MTKIICPHCGHEFELTDSGYQEILAQVKNAQFDQELHQQLENEKLKNDRQIVDLQNQIEKLQSEKLAVIELEKMKISSEKNQQISDLKTKLDTLTLKAENAQKDAIREVEIQRDEIKNQLILTEKEQEISLSNLTKNHEEQLKALSEQVEFYKNFKAQQSTKAIGESLENYCQMEFDKLRATAFQTAYFDKDNEISKTGSKGDFVFRDFDENGLEYISIMFEMKNEADLTATKHRNRDFFKELDKDRNEKNCEYAVLVSMLENDNDYYNTGIVEVHEYPKMYVVRPQFFIQIISLLRNAARNSLEYKQELAIIRNQNIDITNFENEMEAFKLNFGTTAKNFNGNLEKLDKNLEDSIKKLTTARDELRKAMKNLGTAENKLDNLTVKRLTKNNPTMKAKFEI